jgi:hypothetical protein
MIQANDFVYALTKLPVADQLRYVLGWTITSLGRAGGDPSNLQLSMLFKILKFTIGCHFEARGVINRERRRGRQITSKPPDCRIRTN